MADTIYRADAITAIKGLYNVLGVAGTKAAVMVLDGLPGAKSIGPGCQAKSPPIINTSESQNVTPNHKLKEKNMVIQSCENPNTYYVTLPEKPGVRFVFCDGVYMGWYRYE